MLTRGLMTQMYLYKRFVPTFDFSNKLTHKNTTIHGDDWHHNAASFNKNGLAYKTVRATTFAPIFDAIIITCKSVRCDLYQVKHNLRRLHRRGWRRVPTLRRLRRRRRRRTYLSQE